MIQKAGKMIVFRAEPGNTFAGESLFSETHHCDAVASAPSVVLLLPKAAILKVLALQPDIAQAFMATLARQVTALRTRLENQNLRTPRERFLHNRGLRTSDHTGPFGCAPGRSQRRVRSLTVIYFVSSLIIAVSSSPARRGELLS